MNLRAARAARGWSQSRLVREIELYAAHRGLTVASTASLSVYVSEWENGRRSVSEYYAMVLRAILGMTNAELLGDEAESTANVTADDYDVLIQRIDSAHSVSGSLVETMLRQAELLRTMDRQLGAPGIVDLMQAHLAQTQRRTRFRRTAERAQARRESYPPRSHPRGMASARRRCR